MCCNLETCLQPVLLFQGSQQPQHSCTIRPELLHRGFRILDPDPRIHILPERSGTERRIGVPVWRGHATVPGPGAAGRGLEPARLWVGPQTGWCLCPRARHLGAESTVQGSVSGLKIFYNYLEVLEADTKLNFLYKTKKGLYSQDLNKGLQRGSKSQTSWMIE